MTPKDLNDYKNSLEGKTLEELEALEQEIIKEADKLNEDMSNAKLKVPTKNYKEAAMAIRRALNKQSVQWQYTLGMVNLYDAWDPEKRKAELAYPIIDATIRTLGALQYKGYDEWKDVIMCTEFFEPIKEEYTKISMGVYDNADKHCAIQDAITKIKTLETPIEAKEIEAKE